MTRLAHDPLKIIWDCADVESPKLSWRELSQVSSGVTLERLGLIKKGSVPSHTECPYCDASPSCEVYVISSSAAKARYRLSCPECGLPECPEEKLRRWTVDYSLLIEEAARCLGCREAREIVSGKLWSLGHATLLGLYRPVWILRKFFSADTELILKELPSGGQVVLFTMGKTPADGLPKLASEQIFELRDFICIRDGALDASGLKSLVQTTLLPQKSPSDVALPENIFRRRGGRWDLRFEGGEILQIDHQKGAEHLARLLANPNNSISVIDLAGITDDEAKAAVELDGISGGGDIKALKEYRLQLNELDASMAEANDNNDFVSAEKFGEMKEALMKQIKETSSGMFQRKGDKWRLPRDAVSKSIKRVKARIRESGMLSLADHLDETIKIGNEMMYNPSEIIVWETSPIIE